MAINVMSSSNFFVMLLLGGSLQLVWQSIRSLQLIVLIYLLQIPFPAHTTVFFNACFEIQKIDLFQGEVIVNAIFNFAETNSFSPKFEMFGIGDMNFISNSGSFFIFLASIFVYNLSRKVVSRTMVPCRRWKWARKLGVAIYVEDFKAMTERAVTKLFIESYFDNLLPLILGLYSFTQYPLLHFVSTRDDAICTFTTLIFAYFVFRVPVQGYKYIRNNFETLHLNRTQQAYGVYYSEIKFKSMG
jgi:hypothetical protein